MKTKNEGLSGNQGRGPGSEKLVAAFYKTLDSIQRNNSTKTAWVNDGHHNFIATVRHFDVHNLFTLLIFGMTTGLFAAVLGKDIFSVPYCEKGKEPHSLA